VGSRRKTNHFFVLFLPTLPTFSFLLVCAWFPNLSYDASLKGRNFPRSGLKVFPSFYIAQFVSFVLFGYTFLSLLSFLLVVLPLFFSFFFFLFFFGNTFKQEIRVYPFRWPLFHPTQNNPAFFGCWCCLSARHPFLLSHSFTHKHLQNMSKCIPRKKKIYPN